MKQEQELTVEDLTFIAAILRTVADMHVLTQSEQKLRSVADRAMGTAILKACNEPKYLQAAKEEFSKINLD